MKGRAPLPWQTAHPSIFLFRERSSALCCKLKTRRLLSASQFYCLPADSTDY